VKGNIVLEGSTPAEDPSFLAFAPDGRCLYAVNELADPAAAGVSAFAVDAVTGALAPLSRRPAGGSSPCHCTVDATGRWLAAACFGDGVLSLFALGPGGDIRGLCQAIHLPGAEPHAHSLTFDGTNRFAWVADLGTDRLLAYRFDASSGRLTPADPAFVALPAGSGPRHLAFHPSGRLAFLACERSSTVTVLRLEPGTGALAAAGTWATVPPGDRDGNAVADVHVSPDGRRVYVSNRGHDSIAIFAVAADDGALEPRGHVPTGGRTPRGFCLAPDGRWLLAANQASDSITAFRIDARTGMLEASGRAVAVPSPVCLKFAGLTPAP
jgi:6-phosphogluconolactonase